MRILGIDPGYAIVGFGVLDYDGYRFTPVHFGSITTEAKTDFNVRLKIIFDDMNTVLDSFRPDVMAIEKLFFNTNQKTGIDVAQARGVILLSAINAGIPVYEYTPLQVKQSVVGYGRAEKPQVMDMTKRILGLASVPKPDDTADALAIAICHGHASRGVKIPKA
ncbi:MAG: crossover junction endodeoxyribonuclease RuvC [Oscillospiraceae bacterium]|nr:crossover junction endodeoxyribonuclease RuvC [Oscillospiraceae bacterium]